MLLSLTAKLQSRLATGAGPQKVLTFNSAKKAGNSTVLGPSSPSGMLSFEFESPNWLETFGTL